MLGAWRYCTVTCDGCAHPHRDIAGASSADFPTSLTKPHRHKHRQHRTRSNLPQPSPPNVYTNALQPCCKPCSPRPTHTVQLRLIHCRCAAGNGARHDSQDSSLAKSHCLPSPLACSRSCSLHWRHELASKKRRGVQAILSSSNIMQLPTAHRYTATTFTICYVCGTFPPVQQNTNRPCFFLLPTLIHLVFNSCLDSLLPQLTTKTLCSLPSKARKPPPHSLHAALVPRRSAH